MLTNCGDHFTICTNIGSLCCIPETNIMLYVDYTSIKKKRIRGRKRRKPEWKVCGTWKWPFFSRVVKWSLAANVNSLHIPPLLDSDQ